MSIVEEIEQARAERRVNWSKDASHLTHLQQNILAYRAAESAANLVAAHPELRYMTVHAYDNWGAWTLDIVKLEAADGSALKNEREITSTIHDELDISETIMPFERYAGQRIDLHELSLKTIS
jgi:hypothetical protein